MCEYWGLTQTSLGSLESSLTDQCQVCRSNSCRGCRVEARLGCIRSLLMLHVNLMLWCALLSLSRKLSFTSRSCPNAQDIVDVAFPDKRLDRFLGKEGPFKSVHEQIGI